MDELINAIEKISDSISNNSSYELWPIIIPIIISLISFIFSIIAFNFERRLLKQNRFDEIIKQYRSKEMFENLCVLYDNWERIKKDLKEGKVQFELLKGRTMIDLQTATRMQKQRATKEKEISITNDEIAEKMVAIKDVNPARRYVSHFFSMFAKYGLDNRLTGRDIRSLWNSDNLSIIPEIIIPLEKEYAKRKFGYSEEEIAKNKTLQNLQSFYTKFR